MKSESLSVIEDYYDYKIKVMLIGDTNVGKTSIIKRYCKNKFYTTYITSVGLDFETKYIKIDGKIVNLQIWDTAGQERYKVLAKNYYKNSDGFLIVYDITNKKTFNDVANWIVQIRDAAPTNIKSVLLGNKSDLTNQRQIDKIEGEELAKENNVKFYETSAQNGDNIDKAFEDLVKDFLKDDNYLNGIRRASTTTSTEISGDTRLNRNLIGKKKCC